MLKLYFFTSDCQCLETHLQELVICNDHEFIFIFLPRNSWMMSTQRVKQWGKFHACYVYECMKCLSCLLSAIVREWRWRKESARDKKRVVPEVLAAYCKKTFWAVVYASKKEDTKLDSFFVPTIQRTPFITLSILAMYLHTKWVFRILHCFKP